MQWHSEVVQPYSQGTDSTALSPRDGFLAPGPSPPHMQAGIDISLYQHSILLLPPGTPCGSFGSVGTYQPRVWVTWSDPTSVPVSAILHELGHNLGLGHANIYGNAQDEQADFSSIM